MVESFSKLKRFYEIDGIENIVKDGTVTYPGKDVVQVAADEDEKKAGIWFVIKEL